MRARLRERICRAVVVPAVFAAAQTASADTPPSFGGVWQAGTTSMDVAVESWGKDCGPQPASTRSSGGGSVKLEQQGQMLIIHGRERDLRSDQCWSPNPTLRRISTSYDPKANVWTTRCKTGDQDPREELGTYTLKALAPDRLLYQDVSHFNWKLNASTCVATITTTQTLHRGTAPLPSPSPALPAATKPAQAPPPTTPLAKPTPSSEALAPEPESKSSCTPKAPARVSLRPHRSEIALGDRVCFQARVTDAAGCAIPDAAITWSLEHRPGVRGHIQAGCFQAGESSAESEGVFKVIAAHGRRHAEATVVVSVESLQSLLAKRLEAGGIVGEVVEAPPAVTTPPSSRVAARALPAEPETRPTRTLTLAAAALAALAGVLLLLVRRSRPRLRASTKKEKQAPARRCPLCGASYPEGNAFCGRDGSELLPPQ